MKQQKPSSVIILIVILGISVFSFNSTKLYAHVIVNPGDTMGMQGDTVTIDFEIENVENLLVHDFGLIIQFPQDLLEFIECVNEGTLTENFNSFGCQVGDTIAVAASRSSNFRPRTGILFKIRLRVRDNALGKGDIKLGPGSGDLRFGESTLIDGSFTAIGQPTSVESSGGELPEAFNLGQNYPNPFNPSTTINFVLPRFDHTTLKVFDMQGKELTTLVDGKLAAGPHETTWNANNLSSGVYFYRLQTSTFVKTKKLILMK